MTAAPSSPQADLIGAILSRKYPLKRLIGTGGMGAVYESQSPEDGKPLAIKVLAIDYLTDTDIKNRFVEEGLTCQRLIHPNIVRVFDVGTAEDGTPYIVMELLDGVPLSAYTRSGGRVPLAQAGIILQGILAGLGAAHAQAIVHRDLKPENVFLAREPNGAFSAKILDFGIAKVMDAAGGMGNKTRTGVLLGTPAYMSPEQIKNAKDVDARADLWSAGVMLYEMLTGRVAFPAPTEYARLAAVINTEPEPVERVDPALEPLAPFIARALRKDREERFGSALEMARALMALDPHGVAGADGGGAGPLSRLPAVASMFAPQGVGVPATAPLGAGQTTDAGRGAGGTLASATPSRPVTDPPPRVVVAPPQSVGGTLPSSNLPVIEHDSAVDRRVALWLVALLVAGALLAGFALGWSVGRMP